MSGRLNLHLPSKVVFIFGATTDDIGSTEDKRNFRRQIRNPQLKGRGGLHMMKELCRLVELNLVMFDLKASIFT